MFKNIVLAAVSLACFGLFASDAKADAIRCDTCMNSADFRTQAVAAGPGIHIVYNITNNTIEQYHVGHDTRDNGADDVPVPATDGAAVGHPGSREQVQSDAGSKADRIGPNAPTYVVPFADLGLNPTLASRTVTDYMRDHNLQGMVASAVGNNDFIMRTIDSGRLEAATAVVPETVPDAVMPSGSRKDRASQPWMNFKIIFVDGSQVTVAIDPGYANGRTVANSARSANGQPIPDEA